MLKSRVLIVTSIPRIPWLYFPIYLWADLIIVCDTSLVEGKNCTIKVNDYYNWLFDRGFGEKIKKTNLYEFDQIRWQANSVAVRYLERKYSVLRQHDGDMRYFSGYLAHRQTLSVVLTIFHRKLKKKLSNEATKIIIFPKKIVSFYEPQLLSSCLGILIAPFVLCAHILVLSYVIKSKISLTFARVKRKEGGIALDLIHGVSLDSDNLHKAGQYSDSFLIDGDKRFSISQHSFLDYGWYHVDFAKTKNSLTGLGADVFGIRSSKPELNFYKIMGLLFSNLINSIKLFVSDITCWALSSQWILLKYAKERFQAQICFLQVRPSVYFSRMDYSHSHHALGAACHALGISFFGVCHSPLGGAGYVPQRSIISFDNHFIYTDIFRRKFFPTWNNGFTNLVPIGVWRSDFIYQSKSLLEHVEVRDKIRRYFEGKFTVALHLPVPQAYMFDTESVDHWMNGFSKLVEQHSDVAFILFPRRLHQAPLAFMEQVEALVIPGRCELSENLHPEWKQSYSWIPLCNMVIGCYFSDTVLEALSCGLPAVMYSDVGRGSAQLEKIDNSFIAYDLSTLSVCLDRAKHGIWPSLRQWEVMRSKIIEEADGNCIQKMKSHLVGSLENKSSIVD
ncbi:MAG: hypothetical protein PVG66_10030 [Chromatiales bacterium]|jgi:hypothetical protein